jgi:DNA-binding NarL/FixJ family response regulator
MDNTLLHEEMNMSNGNPLTPALYKLMEASLILKTTDAKILATHLNRSPATVRTEFQRILAIMNVHCRYAALKTAEDEGWLYIQDTLNKN